MAITGKQLEMFGSDTGFRAAPASLLANIDIPVRWTHYTPALLKVPRGPEGTTYYLTREWNNMIIHYNPRMFDEAGLTIRRPTGPGTTSSPPRRFDKIIGSDCDSNLDDPKMLESSSCNGARRLMAQYELRYRMNSTYIANGCDITPWPRKRAHHRGAEVHAQ